MTDKVEIITGDDISILHPISINYISPNIPISAIVTCRIVSEDKSINYSAEVVQISTQTGADWAKGLINIEMPSAVTAAIQPLVPKWNRGTAPAYMETQINDNGKDTHFAKVTIVKGNVS